jgi:alpha/beta hydrolase fold
MPAIKYRTVDVDGLKVFYREAGIASAPALLLLHGFPTASHMFRDLIPLLADRFRLIAADLPGFGQSDMPPRGKFKYNSITSQTSSTALPRWSASIGSQFTSSTMVRRLAFESRSSTRSALPRSVSQNGNAYQEGLSDGWTPIRAYWQESSQANRSGCCLPSRSGGG